MGAYRPLFSIDVEHTYFESGTCSVLSFMPTPESTTVMKNAGLLLRRLNSGIAVFYDEASEALSLYAGDPQSPLCLAFRVFAKDPCFNVYTALGTPPHDDQLLYFENAGRKSEAGGRIPLHEQAFVGEADYAGLSSPSLAPLLGERDRIIRPVFVVRITIDPPQPQGADECLKFVPKHYYLRFQARRTVWKYYLLGRMARKDSYIADLNSEAEFVYTGEAMLPGNRRALAFRSRAAIPLRQKAPYRFQLKTEAPGGDKVLVKRLAVASSSRINQEEIEGHVVDVSEIYINC